MFALLIIPLLVSGQIIVSSPYKISTYYRLHRYDGQLLYMKVATYGIWCLLISLGIAFLLKWGVPNFTLASWLSEKMDPSKDPKENRLASWLTLLSITMVFVAVLWLQLAKLGITIAAVILKYSFDNTESISYYKQVLRLSALQGLLADGSLGQLFFNSATTDRPVLVSLKSRKVYVGTVNMISEPNEKQGPNLEISINPIMSGYREKDNLRVLFSNDYSNLVNIDTSVIFPLSEVSHASWFDMETHEKVDNNREQKPMSTRKAKRQRHSKGRN